MTAEPQTSPQPQRILVVALSIYAVLSLVSMATMSIGAGILGICMIAAFWGEGGLWRAIRSRFAQAPVPIRRFAWISLGFAMACVLSLVCAKIWPLEFGGKSAHIEILKDSAKIWYFAWPFLLWIALSACTLDGRRKVLLAWLWAFGILSVIGIIQHFTGWPRPQMIPTVPGRYHATLFLGHHLSVASILIFPFFALLDLRSITRSPLRWFFLTAGLITLAFTYSRTLWIALPIGLVFWAFLHFGNRARTAIVVLAALGSLAAFQVPAVRGRLMNQMGIHEREDLWEANWRFFLDRPLTGVGFKRNQELSGYYLMEKYHTTDVFEGHAHDDVLDILGSMGLIGLAAFIAWWAALVAMVVRSIRTVPQKIPPNGALFFGKGLLAAFLVFLLNGLTQVNFWEAKVQHQLMWVAAWAILWCEDRYKEMFRA